MGEGKRGVPRKRREPTEKEKAAGRANLAAGREKHIKMREAARAAGRDTSTVRWKKLISGEITMRDLDDQEVVKMRVRSKDGTFGGPARPIPPHLAQKFHQEIIRRAEHQLRTNVGEAAKVLGKIMADDEVSSGDRIRAANIILERVLGKSPETIRVVGEDPFERFLSDAVGLDRDLDDDAGEQGDEDVAP